LLMGWGHYSVPVKPNRLAPLSNADRGPTCQPPGVGEPGTRCLFTGPARHMRLSPTQGPRQELLSLRL
jgi:hypothetical protein